MMAASAFFIFLLVWLCLPFVPGMIEIRKKTDAAPLKVVQEYDVDVHFFANTFRKYIKKHFSELLSNKKSAQGLLEDETHYFVIDHNNAIPIDAGEKKLMTTYSMLVSTDTLTLPGLMSYLTEIYAADSIKGGKEDIYRALLAEKNIDIAEGSLLLRWMHAGDSINVKPRSVLHGRVSAANSIHLAKNCHFERLYAPTIVFGNSIPKHQTLSELNNLSAEDIKHKVDTRGERWLIEDNVIIPDNSLIESNLVVVGKLKIGKNCRITGSIKSRHELYIGEGTEITGSLVSNENINCAKQCRIAGPVISEKTVFIDAGSIVGSKEKPTTISAEEINVETNTVTYGSIWARHKGIVKDAET